MWLEFFISKRYLLTKRKQKFLFLISAISILGVAVGVAALIVVISVMSGFDYDLRNKILGNMAHITIVHPEGKLEYPKLIQALKGLNQIRGISAQVQAQGFILKEDRFLPLMIKGIKPEDEIKVSDLKNCMIGGSLEELDSSGIILGKELVSVLGLKLNDEIVIYNPQGKDFTFKLKGIFYSGIYDYDLNFVYVRLEKAQEIFGLKENEATQIGIKLNNLYLAQKLKDKIEKLLGFEYTIRSWQEINKNFFSALKLEKITMFIILSLIVLVAAFNIASTLVVTVVEKTRDIGILMAIGLNKKAIKRIFTFEGLLIGLIGVTLGSVVGISISLLLKRYQFIKLPQDIYYIEYLPVRLVFWPDIVLIVLVAILISLFSTIYPASCASRFKPAEALRYE